ncbi:hypothetical protein I601_4054 [Nocardioides dokdonensis FR1436]|uniref:Uncharacterized protein n=1 Tax=Nocardioides dokdonensis FR1436 TaxID=1300347 RepID=A0A1A9GRW5_9ACTN|nr:DUF5666 domain-containing protein [Nocardioides dokdonensis]ANH40450.1 hypothetical protein I601_4054 [Nocardioides dokdonensis FR1436]
MTDAQHPDQPVQPPAQQAAQEDWLHPVAAPSVSGTGRDAAPGTGSRPGPRWRMAGLVAAGVIAGGSVVALVQSSGETAPSAADQTAAGAAQPGGAAGQGGPGGGGAPMSAPVEGTIASLSASSIQVETSSGSQTYLTTSETLVVRGGDEVATTDLVEGDTILLVAGRSSDGGDLVALRIMAGGTEAGTTT